ncbi:MAG: hypothetical protein ACLFTE_06750 [Salinivenus sp.]
MPPPTMAGSRSLRESAHALLDTTAAPWLSLYMPVDPARNRIQLRNLLGQIRDDASHVGLTRADIDPLLGPAEGRLREAIQSDAEMRGVALYLTPNPQSSELLPLPFAPSLVAQVEDRPWLRPLWRGLEPDGLFYVLSLWGGGARLHRASRYHMDVVPLEGGRVPLNAVLQQDIHIESKLDLPTPSSNADAADPQSHAIYRGQDDIRRKRYVESGLVRFFRRLDDRLRSVLGDAPGPTPLVLAGPAELRRLYHKANTYHHTLAAGVEDSSRIQGPSELHRRAWDLVAPHFDRAWTDALDQYHASPARTAANPGSVLLASVEGRVDTLFVAESPVVWGTFDDDAHSIRIHQERQVGDIEFLNAATAATLQSGGTVYVTEPDGVPNDGPVAALLRYS